MEKRIRFAPLEARQNRGRKVPAPDTPHPVPAPQFKVQVGLSDDPEEMEADRMADRILSDAPVVRPDLDDQAARGGRSTSGTPLRRHPREPDDDEGVLRRQVAPGAAGARDRGGSGDQAASSRLVPGAGERLPRYLRQQFEPRFGGGLSHVRVHRGEEAARLAAGFDARAYTLGNHIVFGAGEFAPDTQQGQRLLAHEITHTFQQGGADGGDGHLRRQELQGDTGPRKEAYDKHRIPSDLKRIVMRGGTGEEIAAVVFAIPEPFRSLAQGFMQWLRLTLIHLVREGTMEADTARPWVRSLDVALQLVFGEAAMSQAPAGTVAPEGGWAPGSEPVDLLAGTRTPTASERVEIGQALTPVRTTGGALPTFHERVASSAQTYGERVRARIGEWINAAHTRMVVDRGEAEHGDSTRIHPMSRFVDIATVAKRETDAVFGGYSRGPAFASGVNLFDQWERERVEVEGDPASGVAPMSATDRRAKARALVSYAMSSDRGVATINDEHGAVPSRSRERGVLDGIRDHYAATEERRLILIDRGWPATAGGGRVNLQLWRGADANADRRLFWDSLQIMIHEYLHTLAHPDYEDYADTYGYEAPEYNTLVEGVDSLLTEVVWRQVRPRAPAIQAEVEGAAYAGRPFDSSLIPDVANRRYRSYDQAMGVVNIVGIRNLYAAYFLGRVDLIRASTA